jgi:hypothetical protein
MNLRDTDGVFTKPAGITIVALFFVALLLVAGWQARTAFEAQAAPPAGIERLEGKIDALDDRQRQMQIDVATIKTKVEMLDKRGR